jgi:hypothetical protein
MGEATTCSSPDLGHLCNNLLSLMSDRNLALALNPLHPDGWFALGSASLKVGLISQFFLPLSNLFPWVLGSYSLDLQVNVAGKRTG